MGAMGTVATRADTSIPSSTDELTRALGFLAATQAGTPPCRERRRQRQYAILAVTTVDLDDEHDS
jgi:hypothetical protein